MLKVRGFYRRSFRLIPGLNAGQIAVVIDIPHGHRVRGGVNVGPAIVSERFGHFVDMPLPGVLVVADHLPPCSTPAQTSPFASGCAS